MHSVWLEEASWRKEKLQGDPSDGQGMAKCRTRGQGLKKTKRVPKAKNHGKNYVKFGTWLKQVGGTDEGQS